MSTDSLGISVTLGCAAGDTSRLDDVVEQLEREGLHPQILAGLERDVVGLGDSIDRNRGPAVYVLCQSDTLSRRQIIRLSGMFSARRGPLHTLLVVDLAATQSANILRSIRGAVGDLTRHGSGARGLPKREGHLRDVVGPTSVAVVERTEADAQRRRAAAESGEWAAPKKTEISYAGPAPVAPSAQPSAPPASWDPADTLIARPTPPSPPSAIESTPPRATVDSPPVLADPLDVPSETEETERDDGGMLDLPPLNTPTQGSAVGPDLPPPQPTAETSDPLLDPPPTNEGSTSGTLAGWAHRPIPVPNPGSDPTDFAPVDTGPASAPSPAGATRPIAPPFRDLTQAPEAKPPWGTPASGPTPAGSTTSDPTSSDVPPVRNAAWPMTWADDPTRLPPPLDATSPSKPDRPEPKSSRKKVMIWFVSGVMFTMAAGSLLLSAAGEFAPPPAQPLPPQPGAPASLRPSVASGANPSTPGVANDEAQLIAAALASREIRALDTLLIVPSTSDHMTWWHADDHCRNGTFASLRGFRLPRSVELGQLAAAGFLGDGRYWSSTPGAGSFGDGIQVYDSWVKGLMVTPHDAHDVLTVCVRTR